MVLRQNGSDYDILARYDYEPFGKRISVDAAPGGERLSFIGKEQDLENSLGDFGVRKYDEDIGRFTSTDPLFEKYAGWSPYHYCGNNPVSFVDGNGKFKLKAQDRANYPELTKIVDVIIPSMVHNKNVVNAMAKASGASENLINKILSKESGPLINLLPLGLYNHGMTDNSKICNISKLAVEDNEKKDEDKNNYELSHNVTELFLINLIIHEGVQAASFTNPEGLSKPNPGAVFEMDLFGLNVFGPTWVKKNYNIIYNSYFPNKELNNSIK